MQAARWKRRRGLTGMRVAARTARDPANRLSSNWGWTWLGEGRYQTRGGVLDLDRDGEATIRHVAVRAWIDIMWKGESRAIDTKGAEYDFQELYMTAHYDFRWRDVGLACAAHGPLVAFEYKVDEQTVVCACGAPRPTHSHWAFQRRPQGHADFSA